MPIWAAVALSELAGHTNLQETIARVALPAAVALLEVRPKLQWMARRLLKLLSILLEGLHEHPVQNFSFTL